MQSMGITGSRHSGVVPWYFLFERWVWASAERDYARL